MTPSTSILMIIFFFLIFPLVLAEFARNRSLPTLEDFFVQSRKMPSVMVFFTVYSTWISVFAFLGASAYFYSKGPVYMTTIGWDVLFGILFMILGRRIWQYGKSRRYISPAALFDDVYRWKPLTISVTLIMFFFTVPYLQIQLSGGAYLIEIASGGLLSRELCGLIFYLIIIIYLWAGGLRAVALADIFYGILVFLSMAAVGILLIREAGGVESVYQQIYQLDPLYVKLPGPSGEAGPFLWLALFITVPVGALMGPQMWLRYYAPASKTTFTLMPLLICLISIQSLGTAFAGNAGILLIPGISDSDTIVPRMLLQYAHPVVTALLFCGIASAALSTANSQIHAAAALYTMEIHHRFLKSKASERQLVAVGKWAVLIISIIAYILMLYNPGLIIDTGTVALGGTSQLFPMTLGALFWNRSNKKAGLAGILTGVFFLLLYAFFVPYPASYGALMGLALNGMVFTGGSLLLPKEQETEQRIRRYRLEYHNAD